MNKRSIAIASAVLAVGLIVGIGPAQAKQHGSPPITVRGDWSNDGGCTPTNPPTLTADPVMVHMTCVGGSLYTGGFSGHTVTEVNGTIDQSGNMTGTYSEWFYGVYTGDQTPVPGGLHFEGSLTIDGATTGFHADARIVGGTCGFAGSRGTITYDGNAANGGYAARWVRSAVPTAADPTCNPLDGTTP